MGILQMEDSKLPFLRKMCDNYMDPRDCECGGGYTSFEVDGLEYVRDFANLALQFYNDKEQKNFYLEKVCMLNYTIAYYCVTFWAQNAENDERHLFRGVVEVFNGDKVVLCEIKDDDIISIPPDHDEYYHRISISEEDHSPNICESDSFGDSVDVNCGSAVAHGGVNLG